jgi:hypothetical protein
MVFNLLAPIAGAVIGGIMQSGSQRSATRAQQQTAQQGFAAEQQMARENLAFQREMMNNMAMANMPRQQASNAALQHITDMYGLGDIYGAPAPGNLAGPANFYPGTNIPGAQGMAIPQAQLPQMQFPQLQNVMGFHPNDRGGMGNFGGGFSAGDMRIF